MKYTAPSWVVEDLIQANDKRMAVLAGKPESGKSTVAIQLCAAVLSGTSFWGKQTKKVPTLYWQTEAMPRSIKESLRKLGYDHRRDAAFYAFTGKPSESTLENLHAFLTEHPDIGLVVLETINSVLNCEDVKENKFVKPAFDRFENMMDGILGRVAFLGLAQLKKNETESSGDMLLGATEFRARTGIKMYLRTRGDEDERRLFHSTVRQDGVAIKQVYLDYDPSTGISTLGQTLEDERKGSATRTDARIEKELLGYVVNHLDAPEDDVCAFTTGKYETKKRLLKELVRDGRLTVTGRGVKNSPRVYNIPEIPTEKADAQFVGGAL